MIHTLSGHERGTKQQVFRQLFQLRHDIFVRRRKWTLATRNQLDIDEYDTPEAQYFFGVDEDGNIISHARLTPTTTQSLLADYFPHLVASDWPLRDPAIYEVTRYIVPTKRGTLRAYRAAKAELMLAALEWCQANGINALQAVIDQVGLASFIEACPEVRPLGLPQPYAGGFSAPGGGEAVAVHCPVTAKAIRGVRAFGRLGAPDKPSDEEGYVHAPQA